ncbi:hypothetical protein STEG23_019598, partial [Scotinomys teguina]
VYLECLDWYLSCNIKFLICEKSTVISESCFNVPYAQGLSIKTLNCHWWNKYFSFDLRSKLSFRTTEYIKGHDIDLARDAAKSRSVTP